MAPGTDRWQAKVLLDEVGEWHWHVTGFDDEIATWRHDAALKIDAGVDVELMYEIGARLIDRAVAEKARARATRTKLTALSTALRDPAASAAETACPRRRPAARRVRRPPARPSHDRLPRAHDPRRAPPRRRGLVVRVLPPLRGREAVQGRPVEERHLPHARCGGSTASPRWASTSSTCRRSTPSASPTARARTTR